MRKTVALMLVSMCAATSAAAQDVAATTPAVAAAEPVSATPTTLPAPAAMPEAAAASAAKLSEAVAKEMAKPAATAPAAASTPASVAPSSAKPQSSKSRDVQLEQVEKESAVLSPEKAKAYNEAMSKAIDASLESRNKIRKTYDEADALLTAETFDKKAFLAKANEIDTLYAESRAKLNEVFASTIENYTQAERKALLKSRNENRKRPAQP